MVGSNELMEDPDPHVVAAGEGCRHGHDGPDPAPNTEGCEDCLAAGMTWVHLRLCLTCGHVGCCDASEGQHATRHFKETGHRVIRSHEQGERWCWCFEDQTEP